MFLFSVTSNFDAHVYFLVLRENKYKHDEMPWWMVMFALFLIVKARNLVSPHPVLYTKQAQRVPQLLGVHINQNLRLWGFPVTTNCERLLVL